MSDPATRAWKGGRLLLLLAVGVGGFLLLGRFGANLYTDLLWFRSAGYESVFWARTLAEAGMRVVVGGGTAVLAFLNFRVVARTLGVIQIRRRFGDLEFAERLPRRTIVWGVAASSLLMGLWLGASFPQGAGLRLRLLLEAPRWGLEVPPLGRDASFFVFSLPLLEGALILGLSLTFLLFSFTAAGYAATGSLRLRGGRPEIAPLPRKHLAALLALFLLLLAARFWIAPYLLMLDGNSAVQGIFGFADAHSRIPAYRALATITALAAGMAWWGGLRRRPALLASAVAGVALAGLLLVQILPQMVQRFQVRPNELERETPFIEANLRFTRVGFGLDRMQRERFPYEAGEVPDWGEAARQLAGLPIWTPATLLTTFRSVEARFPYYDFELVTHDRYPSPEGVATVAVAVREIDRGGIGDPNWQNLHLRYLAGMGAVASAANQATREGRPPMFLSGIPPVAAQDASAPPGLELTEPAVFFGSRHQLHAIVSPQASPPGLSVPDSASLVIGGRPSSMTPAAPPDIQGIGLSNLARALSLAWRFRDANLLLASEVSRQSTVVFRRSVAERAGAIAPFLRFLEPPYPVVHDGRIVWILDGFTATGRFPLSSARALPGGGAASYVRNSVKITVDALTGATRFYRVDVQDPLLEAWSRVFPDLLRPLEEMPAALRSHVRYPKALLELQAEILLQYHQDTPPRFHGQQDVWAPPQELAEGSRPVPYLPEYGFYRLPGREAPEFLLSTVFVPAGRQNLTALLVARCDPPAYGELLLYDIAVEEQVQGPRQVEALVEQDPVISSQFSLWRQGGSQVWSGHLHIVPVGNTLLYLEPIFLAAEADAIPELRRFVASDGTRVVMEASLGEALVALARATGSQALPLGVGAVANQAGAGEPGTWPREALDLLDQAEERLRQGDWAGFGAALDRLRTLLGEWSGRSGGG